MITDFHAKYFAYELGRRCSSDSVEKLTAVLADAQVDLNELLDEIGRRLEQRVEQTRLFTLRWRLT